MNFRLVFFLAIISYSCQEEAQRTYYEDGTLRSYAQMKDGKMNGKHEFYYPSGKLQSSGTYTFGIPDGEIRHYFEDGSLKSRAMWRNGKESGLAEVFYENGKLHFSAFYKNGKIVGISKVFSKNGNLSERKKYDDLGTLVHIATFDVDGSLNDSFVVPSVEPSEDTVKLGDNLTFKIKFPIPMKGEIHIRASITDDKGSTTFDSEILNCTSEDSVKYRHRFDRPGKNTITFEFDHSGIGDDDTLNVKNVIKDSKIVVLDSVSIRKV